jgi:hypothetical protein
MDPILLPPELPEMPPFPPPLQREISDTRTNQYTSRTCQSHVNARLALQNLFYFINKDLSDRRISKCNLFLKNTTLLREMHPYICGISGIQKIIMFRLFFSIYYSNVIINRDNTDSNIIMDVPLFPSMELTQYSPYYMIYSQLLALYTIDYIPKRYNLKMVTFTVIYFPTFKALFLRIIKKITDQGFYIKARLIRIDPVTKSIVVPKARHSVTIVKVQNENYIIKNSWGSDVIQTDSLEFIQLSETKIYTCVSIEFFLPVKTFNTELIIEENSNLYKTSISNDTVTSNLRNVIDPEKAETWIDKFCTYVYYLRIEQNEKTESIYDYIFDFVIVNEKFKQLLDLLHTNCGLDEEIIREMMELTPEDRFIRLVGESYETIQAEYVKRGGKRKTRKYIIKRKIKSRKYT